MPVLKNKEEFVTAVFKFQRQIIDMEPAHTKFMLKENLETLTDAYRFKEILIRPEGMIIASLTFRHGIKLTAKLKKEILQAFEQYFRD
jgi:hypothetical protein